MWPSARIVSVWPGLAHLVARRGMPKAVSDGLFDLPGAPQTSRPRPGRVGRCTAGGPHASGIAGRGGRTGPPAGTRIAAAPPGRGLRRGVGRSLRPAGKRQDDAGCADLTGDRPPVRGAVGVVGRCQRRSGRHRHAPETRSSRRADGAVHRRSAPLLQDPAGRPAVRRGEPGGVAGGGDHREPVVLRGRAAAVTVADPAVAAADGRRRPHRGAARDRRSPRPGRAGRGGARGRRPAGAIGRRRCPARADGVGGRSRGGPGGRRGGRRSRPSSSPWTRPRCATTATATSTTTSSAPSSSRCAAPTSTPRCTTWPACSSPGRIHGSSRAG